MAASFKHFVISFWISSCLGAWLTLKSKGPGKLQLKGSQCLHSHPGSGIQTASLTSMHDRAWGPLSKCHPLPHALKRASIPYHSQASMLGQASWLPTVWHFISFWENNSLTDSIQASTVPWGWAPPFPRDNSWLLQQRGRNERRGTLQSLYLTVDHETVSRLAIL